MTLLLEIILIFMLQSGGISGKNEELIKRVGEDVFLHCNVDASSNQCSDIRWLYNRHSSTNTEEITNTENEDQSSARASRLSVSSDCSLLITNITDEDAGRYECKTKSGSHAIVYLNILSISSSPSDVYGRVDLTCSLLCFGFSYCKQNSIIWMNETGSQLSGNNPEFEGKKQTNCVSVLTVKHQSGNNKRFTCKFVKDEEVKIDADYVLTDISGQTKHLYQRVGDDVLLPCGTKSSSSSCSDVNWLYQKDPNAASITEVKNGNVVQSSARASRLSVSSDCSLLITNITDEDAGRFLCRLRNKNEFEAYLNTLSNISGQTKHLYQRVGDDVLLPCRTKSSSSSCSDVNWLYQKDPNAASITEVKNGNVVQSSARASRLSVSSDCSLLITNITDEDAGRFLCRLRNKNEFEVYLNTLSISKDPPEVHPRGNGSVTLQCSLNRHDRTIPCKQNSIIWVDETGSHLSGEGVGLEFRGQTNCDSVLIVKHQSGNNKRFTCKFVEDDEVKIDAVYVLDFSDVSGHNIIIIVGAVMKVVLMFVGVVAALVYMYRRRTKENEDQRTRRRRRTVDGDEDDL
ncbi:uncharacterized protein LOC105358411 isoform X1 [Oryzias latipes]